MFEFCGVRLLSRSSIRTRTVLRVATPSSTFGSSLLRLWNDRDEPATTNTASQIMLLVCEDGWMDSFVDDRLEAGGEFGRSR